LSIGSEQEAWLAGAEEELRSLRELGVYKLVQRSEVPKNRKILRGRFVCHRKCDMAGTIAWYKVWWVTKGFEQVFSIDYNLTTVPTVRLESFRAILHLAAAHNWDIQQFDVNTAFLYGLLPEDEVIYMEQLDDFHEPEGGLDMATAMRIIWNETEQMDLE
jgi:hypothetical protein